MGRERGGGRGRGRGGRREGGRGGHGVVLGVHGYALVGRTGSVFVRRGGGVRREGGREEGREGGREGGTLFMFEDLVQEGRKGDGETPPSGQDQPIPMK
ncbi:hypothetical protein Naga_100734g1 [Nannochloropsis gaditana]|uniref:Uncharacterized protein n=1 Tax=Nannochloropsis gaditana TaxID=72520 RepID=W7T9P0_9STRA|nr:hypothetical protein Naga_100734g1 [Nannochloropsis gaditana]